MNTWKNHLPRPVWDEHPEYNEFYMKAWELAHDHIKSIPGMPQSPYMDEAFCDSQIWIWDTCFMALFCKYARAVFPGVESLRNFYEVLYNGKKLATVIPGENEPEWTKKTKGQPSEMDIHIADNPPLFAWAEYENALMKGDKEYLRKLLCEEQFLQKHFEWIESLTESVTPRGVHASTCLMAEPCGYRWEGGRSGMDNTPRGRLGNREEKQRPKNPDMLWLDALCQQALSAQMIAALFGLLEDGENQALWQKRFEEKAQLLNGLYWDEEDQFYYDIDRNTHRFYKVMTVASYWAMTAKAATPARAAALVRALQSPETLGGTVPFPSLSRSDNDYSPNGKYWRGGVWLPTSYAALTGLKNYGYYAEAHTAARTLLEHMYRTYTDFEPHTIWECYAPEACTPATTEWDMPWVRKDFCGWSALGPISIYIEFVLGFHTVNAFTKTVEWALPAHEGKLGIRNLHFGEITTDILEEKGTVTVTADQGYTLIINGTPYPIQAGENQFSI
ncbi:MAG: hypothetical protein IJP27_01545 [Clostridia bacterium]|nr:hypothetical protein [Clostridia bacterium]